MEEEAVVAVPEENPWLLRDAAHSFEDQMMRIEEESFTYGSSQPAPYDICGYTKPSFQEKIYSCDWLQEETILPLGVGFRFHPTDVELVSFYLRRNDKLLSTKRISYNTARKDSAQVKFSMITASKGGFDIKIGSHTIHVRKYASARHALVSMILFAGNLLDDTFSCAKSMVPTRILNFLDGSISSTSPKVYEAGWVPAKARPESRNAGVTGETPVGSIGRKRTSRVPVLFDVSKLAGSEPGSTAVPLATPTVIKAEEDEHAAYYDAMSDADTLRGMESRATRLAPAASLLEQNPLTVLKKKSEMCIGHMDGVREVTHTKAEHNSVMEVAEEKTAATWLVATAAAHHATGNRGLLSGFTPDQPGRLLRTADGAAPMQVLGRGSVITDTVVLPDVLYVAGLTANLVSPSQLAELDYTVRFSRGACHIRNATDGNIVGKASVGLDGAFELDFLKVLPAI